MKDITIGVDDAEKLKESDLEIAEEYGCNIFKIKTNESVERLGEEFDFIEFAENNDEEGRPRLF